MKLIKSKLYVGLVVVLSVLVCFVAGIMLMSARKTAFAVEVEYGSGAEGDTYLISSADELYTLSQTNSDWGKNFKLTQAIDLSTVCYEGKSWMPIGNGTNKFKGTFDGDDYTISGLYIDSTEGWQGLFGYVENGTIKNLTVKGTVSGKGYVGGIVGYFDVGTVEKCSFEGAVKGGSSGQPVGGIAGYNRSGTITKCSNIGEVSCWSEYAGGIVGQNYGTNAKVSDCENTGTISLIDSTGKGSTVGGIVGINVGGSKIINCSNTGTIGAENNLIVGGIVGKNNGGSVTQCYNTGIVIGKDYMGGVAGQNIAQATINQCYNTGAVSGSQYIGGVVGQNDDGAAIMSCYNTATVTGSSNVGGLVGKNFGGSSKQPTLGTVKNSYNRGTVTGNNSGGVVGVNKGNNSEGTVENCYYLTGTAAGGVNKADTNGATVKTEAAFNSGEIAWLLQKVQPDYGIQVWGQRLKGNEHDIEKYPVLTDQLPKRVWKASFIKNGEAIYVTYVNNGGTITPPAGDEWCESNGAPFNSTVQITEDKILGLHVQFGVTTDNIITENYGRIITKILDECVFYRDGSDVGDRFDYEIISDDGIDGAEIVGNVLTIPDNVDVKDGGYTLSINVHEKIPLVDTTVRSISALSATGVDSYDVILTVKIFLRQINQDPFTIDKLPNGVTYGDENVMLSATGGSGDGPIVWSVESGSDIVDIDRESGALTIKRASRSEGDVKISATKFGGVNYNNTYDTVTLTVQKANQTDFSINEIPSGVTYGDTGKSLTTTGGWSGGTVTWSVDNPLLLEVASDGSLDIKGAGIVVITAIKSGGDNYETATATVTIEIHKAVQADFAIVAPTGVTYGDGTFTLTASGGRKDGMPNIVWNIVDGVSRAHHLGGGEFAIDGAGAVTIKATIDGGANYEDADDTITIEIHKAVQTDFAIVAPTGVTYGDGTFTLTASGGRKDGTPNIEWNIVDGVSRAHHLGGGEFAIDGAGAVTIKATIDGGANYENAADTVTIEIHKANQIGFSINDIPGGVTYKQDGTFTLNTAGGLDGAEIIWKVESGNEFASHAGGGVFNILGAGTVIISAAKTGNANYEDANDTITLVIHKANQTGFTIDNIPSGVTYKQGGTFTLETAGGLEGAEVIWNVESGKGFASHAGGGVFNILGAGTVIISATKTGNANYENATDSITLNIHKAIQYNFTIVAPTSITYGDENIVLTTTGAMGNGALIWSVERGDTYAKINFVSGALEIKGAGTVVITATKDGDANYEGAFDTITIEILKAVQNPLKITNLPTGTLTINTELNLAATGGSSGEKVRWAIEGDAELDADTGAGIIRGVGATGYVIITATMPGGDNYYDVSTSITLHINKANQDALIIGVPGGIVYKKDGTVALTCGGGTTNGKVTWRVAEDDLERAVIDESTGVLTIKNAGTVTVYATMAGDEDYYAATASTTFTINKAYQDALTITINRDLNGITFGDTGIVFETFGGSGGGTVVWSVAEGLDIVGINSLGGLTIKHASKGVNDVTVLATKAGDNNYYETTATITFTVNKANQSSLVIIAPGGITFGDENVKFSATGGSVGGTVIWSVAEGSDIVGINSLGGLIIKHASKQDNDVTVSATMPGGDDYYDITTYFTFTVNKANQSSLKITTDRELNGITFGDIGIVFGAEGGSTGGEITWSVAGDSDYYVAINARGELTIKHASKNPGDITIFATMAGNGDYYEISTSISFTVNKANQAPLTISINDDLNGITFGDTDIILIANGGRDGGTAVWSIVEGSDIVGIDAFGALTIKRASRLVNDVTISATVSGGDDYYDTWATITFTVNKANQPALTIDAPNGIAYGDSVELSYNGGRDGGTVQWSVSEGSCAEINGSALTTLGTGEVTITAFMAGGDNYYDTYATITFTIRKANQPAFMIVDLPSGVTYSEDGTFTLSTEGGIGGTVIWSVAEGGEYVSHLSGGGFKILGAGDVTVKAIMLGGDNYYDTSAIITFTVNKANQEAFKITDLPDALTFDDVTFTLGADGGWANGTVTWNVVSGYVTHVGDGTFKILGAGEVIISATKSGGNNYYDITTSIRFAIGKATPYYSAPEGLTAIYGYTLADVKLSDGWTWNDLSVSVGAVGIHVFSATFTPSDTANYNTVTVALFVSVVKAIPLFTVPTGLVATVGDTLADVVLPEGWSWVDPLTTEVGDIGERTFAIRFTPSDTDNYEIVTVDITVTVHAAGTEDNTKTSYWWLWIIIVITVIIFVLLLLLLLYKKRKKKEETEKAVSDAPEKTK